MEVRTMHILVFFITGLVSTLAIKQHPDVESMSSQIEELKADFTNQIQNLLTIIQEQNQKHDEEISKLQSEVLDLRKTCTQLATDAFSQSTTPTYKNGSSDSNTNPVAVGGDEATTDEDQENVQKITTNGSPVKRVGSSFASNVAFYAYLSHDVAYIGNDDQPIVFDHEETDLANSYNPTTGMFHCTISGVYVFHVHILSEVGKNVDSRLVKNGQTIAYIYSGGRSGMFDHGGNTAIVKLDEGDSVWTKAVSSGTDTGNVIDYHFSSISGFLLYSHQ